MKDKVSIGDIITINGSNYRCEECSEEVYACAFCDLYSKCNDGHAHIFEFTGSCVPKLREDGKKVCYKKIEDNGVIERQIGETFEYEGNMIKVVKDGRDVSCKDCIFRNGWGSGTCAIGGHDETNPTFKITGPCQATLREDNTPVHFETVEPSPDTIKPIERQPGETFEYEGDTIEVVEDSNHGFSCDSCANYYCPDIKGVGGECKANKRSDGKNVHFVVTNNSQVPLDSLKSTKPINYNEQSNETEQNMEDTKNTQEESEKSAQTTIQVEIDGETYDIDIKDAMEKKVLRPSTLQTIMPMNIEDFIEEYLDDQSANSTYALQIMIAMRNKWWEKLNWTPDWSNGELKYTIRANGNGDLVKMTNAKKTIFAFPTESTRDLFLESFENILSQCVDFIGHTSFDLPPMKGIIKSISD